MSLKTPKSGKISNTTIWADAAFDMMVATWELLEAHAFDKFYSLSIAKSSHPNKMDLLRDVFNGTGRRRPWQSPGTSENSYATWQHSSAQRKGMSAKGNWLGIPKREVQEVRLTDRNESYGFESLLKKVLQHAYHLCPRALRVFTTRRISCTMHAAVYWLSG